VKSTGYTGKKVSEASQLEEIENTKVDSNQEQHFTLERTRTNSCCAAIEYITYPTKAATDQRNLLLFSSYSYDVLFNLTIKHQSRGMRNGPDLNLSFPVFKFIKNNMSFRKLSFLCEKNSLLMESKRQLIYLHPRLSIIKNT